MPEESERTLYRIVIQGHLDPTWSDWLGQMHLSYDESDCTVLTGAVVDQAALHGILSKIRDLNLILLEVNRIQPADE